MICGRQAKKPRCDSLFDGAVSASLTNDMPGKLVWELEAVHVAVLILEHRSIFIVDRVVCFHTAASGRRRSSDCAVVPT